jgi:hypothetical protein
MGNILALDPGLHTGYAIFTLGVLVKAGVVTPDEPVSVPRTYLVVIESPARIYSQGTVTSILHLARCVGRYQERYSDHTVRLVEPREWKGTIDGDIMAARIKATLSADTRDKLPKMTKSVEHNMLDAIGLGQWSLRQPWGRMRSGAI